MNIHRMPSHHCQNPHFLNMHSSYIPFVLLVVTFVETGVDCACAICAWTISSRFLRHHRSPTSGYSEAKAPRRPGPSQLKMATGQCFFDCGMLGVWTLIWVKEYHQLRILPNNSHIAMIHSNQGEISLLVPEVVLRLLGDRSYDRRKQVLH